MSTAANAATTVDSATTETSAAAPVTPSSPAFDATDQKTWSGAQRETWNKTGAQPTSADSATADKDTNKDTKKDAVADSAPQPKDKTAASASDSATDTSKPHLKTKEDTEKRFKDILDENKALQRRLESLERGERGKSSETRDAKQESQPAAEVYKPLDEKEFFKANATKTYEDFVRAAVEHGSKHAAEEAIKQYKASQQLESAQKELSTSIEDAKKRYPDYTQRIDPGIQAIVNDQQIPYAVKAVINESPVFADLMYVLTEPKALADIIHTAKSNPAAAIRKIVLTEQLVQAELAKQKEGAQGKDNGKDKTAAGEGKDGTDANRRDASGKFVSSQIDENKDGTAEPKPRAPKPPSEVGGRGTASEDVLRTAAAASDFRAFEAEEWRRKKASRA